MIESAITRTKLALIIGLLLLNTASAETRVSAGDVSGEWTAEGSPYLIEGEIRVQPGDTLRLQAGTRVVFRGHYGLSMRGWMNALGTESDTVVFTCEPGEEGEGWKGIYVFSPSVDTMRFSYVKLENVRRESSSLDCGFSFVGCTVRLEHCLFQYTYSCAIYQRGSSHCTLFECEFRDNGFDINAGLGSACLITESSTLTGTNCRFVNNFSNVDGGAIHAGTNCTLTLDHCDFRDNGCNLWGGAIDVNRAKLRIRNCTFLNSTGYRGGTVYLQWPDTTLFDHCLFENSSAMLQGSVVFITAGAVGPVTFSNCNFARNQGNDDGAIYAESEVRVVNSIFYQNTGSNIFFAVPGAVEYCLSYPREGNNYLGQTPVGLGLLDRMNTNGDSVDAYQNMFFDPQFADADNGDYHLLENSPCIDAGHPAMPPDPDGTIADIGLFYFEQEVVAEPERRVIIAENMLLPPSPNPFNPSTTLRFNLSASAHVSLCIFDLMGREVSTLVDENLSAGEHSATWYAAQFSSGTYFAILYSGREQSIQKLLLLK